MSSSVYGTDPSNYWVNVYYENGVVSTYNNVSLNKAYALISDAEKHKTQTHNVRGDRVVEVKHGRK